MRSTCSRFIIVGTDALRAETNPATSISSIFPGLRGGEADLDPQGQGGGAAKAAANGRGGSRQDQEGKSKSRISGKGHAGRGDRERGSRFSTGTSMSFFLRFSETTHFKHPHYLRRSASVAPAYSTTRDRRTVTTWAQGVGHCFRACSLFLYFSAHPTRSLPERTTASCAKRLTSPPHQDPRQTRTRRNEQLGVLGSFPPLAMLPLSGIRQQNTTHHGRR